MEPSARSGLVGGSGSRLPLRGAAHIAGRRATPLRLTRAEDHCLPLFDRRAGGFASGGLERPRAASAGKRD